MKYILGEVAQDVFVYYFSRHSLYEVSFLYGTQGTFFKWCHVYLHSSEIWQIDSIAH